MLNEEIFFNLGEFVSYIDQYRHGLDIFIFGYCQLVSFEVLNETVRLLFYKYLIFFAMASKFEQPFAVYEGKDVLCKC